MIFTLSRAVTALTPLSPGLDAALLVHIDLAETHRLLALRGQSHFSLARLTSVSPWAKVVLGYAAASMLLRRRVVRYTSFHLMTANQYHMIPSFPGEARPASGSGGGLLSLYCPFGTA